MLDPNEGPYYPICPIHEIEMNILLAIDSTNPDIKIYRCPHEDHNDEFEEN